MDIFSSVIVDILALLVTLGILVTFHEYGHFWVARRCKVKVERFSIGFGKPLLRWRGRPPAYVTAPEAEEEAAVVKAGQGAPEFGLDGSARLKGGTVSAGRDSLEGGTEYVIAALPLGGYVKMLGEMGRNVPPWERHLAFNNKPLAQRSAIVAAGPLANFLLAVVLYWILFMTGISGVAPVVGRVVEDSQAAAAGFTAGDEIVAVDGKSTDTWQEVRLALLGRLGETGNLEFTLRPGEGENRKQARVPIQDWLAGEAEPDILGALGITPFRLDIPARIGELVPGGRAEEAGLRPGDLVIAVDGKPLGGWLDWIDVVRANPEQNLRVTVQRGDETRVLTLRPALTGENGAGYGFIGAGVQQPEQLPTLPPEMNREVRYSPIAAAPRALRETWGNTLFILESIKKMVVGLISVENLSGPITIAQVAGETAVSGLEYFIGFLAILSISLGVLNLLPIPVLDGGHLFYYLIEFVIRRPVPERIQELGMQLGLLIIVGITFIAFYNDINRLF